MPDCQSILSTNVLMNACRTNNHAHVHTGTSKDSHTDMTSAHRSTSTHPHMDVRRFCTTFTENREGEKGRATCISRTPAEVWVEATIAYTNNRQVCLRGQCVTAGDTHCRFPGRHRLRSQLFSLCGIGFWPRYVCVGLGRSRWSAEMGLPMWICEALAVPLIRPPSSPAVRLGMVCGDSVSIPLPA